MISSYMWQKSFLNRPARHKITEDQKKELERLQSLKSKDDEFDDVKLTPPVDANKDAEIRQWPISTTVVDEIDTQKFSKRNKR